MDMKQIILCISFLFIPFLGCDKSTEPTNDPTATIIGSVISKENNEQLDSVLVGFKNPSIPDSLVFVGDSVLTGLSDSAVTYVYTLNGYFSFGWAFVPEPPVKYVDMFAYKPGKKLWRFNPASDTIYQLISNIDSLKIRMENK
jgi:hypothetical protein